MRFFRACGMEIDRFHLRVAHEKETHAHAMVGLSFRVTDDGFHSLAKVGCGAQLTSLTLWGECIVCE